jgi:putative PEP-CTERM system TPR-repeat lipoprotein
MLKNSQPAGAVAALAPALADGKSQDPQLLALAGESAMRNRDFGNASQYFEKASVLAPNAAALHTSLGMAKLGAGDQAQGISELERGTALDPKSTQAGIALVRAELALKHFDKAQAAMKALVAAHPDDAIVRNLEGGVYIGKGDLAGARASFEKSSALQATYLEPVLNLAQLDLKENKPDAAKQRLVAFLEKDKKSVGAMSALAGMALNQNKIDEATTWLEKANAENPDAVMPAVQLVNHYLRTDQKQKALLLTRKLQIANPTNVDLLDLHGQAQLANKDNAGALETYSKLAGAAPKSAAAQFRLASVHMLLKNEAAAAEDLKKALVLQPGFMPALLGQSELALRQNRPDDALAIARQMQKVPTGEAAGFQLEADVMKLQKKPALALPLYEKAFALAKTPKLMIAVHGLQAQLGKQQEADQRLAQWNRDHPTDALTAMYAAEINISKKQYKLAIPQLVAVLKQAPNNAIALNNLAWCYQQEKDPKALETAEHAYKVAGDAPAVMDTLGTILTEQGDTKRSVPLLQKAVAGAPASLDLRLHLAQALVKSGDKVNARKELQQIVAKGNGFAHLAEAELLLKQL